MIILVLGSLIVRLARRNECNSFKSHLEPNLWSNCRAYLRGNGTPPGLGLERRIRFLSLKVSLKVVSTRVSHFQVPILTVFLDLSSQL